MELTRARPRPAVAFTMPVVEDETDTEDLVTNINTLGSVTEMVVLGQDEDNFSKTVLAEYIKELVYQNHTDMVIEQVDESLRRTIENALADIDTLNEAESQDVCDVDDRNFQLLCKIEMRWCHLRNALGELMQLFRPAEAASRQRFSIWRTGMRYYREQLEKKDRLQDRLMAAALDLIAAYREGKEVIFCQLRNMSEMFSFVGMYDTFEERMCVETRTYYRQLVSQVLSQNSVPESCRTFQEKIRHEEECCRMYLVKPSVPKVMDIVRVQVLHLNADVLLHEKELQQIITSGDLTTLDILLSLYGGTELKEKLHDTIFTAMQSIGDCIISEFIKDHGVAPLEIESAAYDTFIMKLWRLKDDIDAAITKVAPFVVDYKNRVQIIWDKMLNNSPDVSYTVISALAVYVDNEPHSAEPEQSSSMSFIMHLFRAITNKSHFEEAFRAALSKRLLYTQEINESHVEIVNTLKEECGTTYAAKLDALVTDFLNSKRYNTEHAEAKREVINCDGADEIPFSALVISTDTWLPKAHVKRPETDDAFADCDIDSASADSVPIEVKYDAHTVSVRQMQKRFVEFYSNRYKNRSLQFLPDFGSAILQMEFNGDVCSLKLSICQAYCLLAFNSMDAVSLASLSDTMEKEYNEIILRKHLAALNSQPNPLIVFKHAVLNFENCSINDQFILNMGCEPPAKFWDLQYKDSLCEKKTTVVHRGVTVDDIAPSIEATIVRHLKTKLEESATTMFKICSEKFTTVDRFAFNQIVDSLVSRDFVALDPRKDLIKYVP